MTLDDLAEAAEQRDRDICLQYRKPQLAVTGYCWNCSEECKGVYCSPECRQDAEKRERFNR